MREALTTPNEEDTMTKTYESPAITPIGSLHSMTLLNKDLTGVDGVNLIIGPISIALGPIS